MNIKDTAEYDAAAIRANALMDARDGIPEEGDLARLSASRVGGSSKGGEHFRGPELVSDLTRPDDLTVSGLPGNLGIAIGRALALSLAAWDRQIKAMVSPKHRR